MFSNLKVYLSPSFLCLLLLLFLFLLLSLLLILLLVLLLLLFLLLIIYHFLQVICPRVCVRGGECLGWSRASTGAVTGGRASPERGAEGWISPRVWGRAELGWWQGRAKAVAWPGRPGRDCLA